MNTRSVSVRSTSALISRVPMYPEQTLLGISKKLKGVWIEPSEGEPVFSDAWLEG